MVKVEVKGDLQEVNIDNIPISMGGRRHMESLDFYNI